MGGEGDTLKSQVTRGVYIHTYLFRFMLCQLGACSQGLLVQTCQ